MHLTALLILVWLLLGAGSANSVLESRFEIRSRDIGSLCSAMTFQACQRLVTETLAHSLLGCAARCAREGAACLSFSFQLQPYGPNHTHRCELSGQEAFPLHPSALRAHGYNYYSKLGPP